jgi:hypothetical protein
MRARGPLRLLLTLLLSVMAGVIVLQGITTIRQLADASSNAPLQFSEASIMADCGLTQPVAAWLDTNANGRRELNEPPLPDVEFFVTSVRDGQESWDYGRMGVSDATGTASLHQFIGGCDKLTFDISARPPAGYRATTAEHVLSERYWSEDTIEFGFVTAP